MVLGFIAEHSLSLSMVPRILELMKAAAVDKKALNTVSMDRTSAAYKLRFGLAKTIDDALVSDLKTCHFSFNIDEATSHNNKRVLAVLVSYFSPSAKQVVVSYLSSFSVIRVNSNTMHTELVGLMEKKNLPWQNLVSILMDSCAVMRGSKSGLETRIRQENAPHLLDIDGDRCHHAHNSAKKFCAVFQQQVERLFCDVFADFKWSADLRQYFEEVCKLIGVKYTVPQRYISHRWLSVYDVALDHVRLSDALILFYYSFLSKEDRALYHSLVVGVH